MGEHRAARRAPAAAVLLRTHPKTEDRVARLLALRKDQTPRIRIDRQDHPPRTTIVPRIGPPRIRWHKMGIWY